MTMIEQVARVLIQHEWENTDKACCSLTKEEYELYHWKSKQGEARAAIEAMREPSDEMLGTAMSYVPRVKANLKFDWQAMIDKALEEQAK